MKKSVAEIEREIQEFVNQRDRNEFYNFGNKLKAPMKKSGHHKASFFREGREILRDKVCSCEVTENQVCDICQGVK